jgi:hypothetical protein
MLADMKARLRRGSLVKLRLASLDALACRLTHVRAVDISILMRGSSRATSLRNVPQLLRVQSEDFFRQTRLLRPLQTSRNKWLHIQPFKARMRPI